MAVHHVAYTATDQCRLWVKNGPDGPETRLPVRPEQRTLDRLGWSGWCQQETHAPQQTPDYSITSSARSRKVSGTTIPNPFAVFKLTARSILVGCATGRSAGLAPLRILST